MKKYVGKKWSQLTIEVQHELLSSAFTTEKVGDCIIDLTENLSVFGKVISTDEEDIIEVDNDAILYDPTDSVIVENPKFKGLVSLKDAAIMFGKEESTLRRNISNGFFREWEDCVKFGKQWVFDIKALEKKYKKNS